MKKHPLKVIQEAAERARRAEQDYHAILERNLRPGMAVEVRGRYDVTVRNHPHTKNHMAGMSARVWVENDQTGKGYWLHAYAITRIFA